MKRLIIPAALIVLLAVVATLVLIPRGSADTEESSTSVTTQATQYVKVPVIIRETETSTVSAETRQAQVVQGVQTGSAQSGYTLPATGKPIDTPPDD